MLDLRARSARDRAGAVAFVSALGGCAGAREAPRVELPLHASLRPEAVETDMGYQVELDEARLILQDVEFAVGGEAHAFSPLRSLSRWFLPQAHAHTGHLSGGEVTGELRGRFVASWLPEVEAHLGTASLIAGDYESVNFTLVHGTDAESLAAGDELLDHGALLRGVAQRGAERREFTALVDIPAVGSDVAGVPFAGRVQRDMSARLAIELSLQHPFEGDTLFDGIDFGRLRIDESGGAIIHAMSSDAAARSAHARLAAALQAPDHYQVRLVP